MRSLLMGYSALGFITFMTPLMPGASPALAAQSRNCQPVAFSYVGVSEKPFPKRKLYFANFLIANNGKRPIAISISRAWGVTLVYVRSAELQEKIDGKWITQPDLVESTGPDKSVSVAPGSSWSFSFPFDTPIRNGWHDRIFRLRVVSEGGCGFTSDPFSI